VSQGERKRKRHFLFLMQEMGAKIQNGGPTSWSYTEELGEYA
jgi:hypothetical protein